MAQEDLAVHEHAHGPIPPGACVALRSGWDAHLATPRFRNADASGALRFPGFGPDTAPLLLERGVAGVAVDTLSLDHGGSGCLTGLLARIVNRLFGSVPPGGAGPQPR